jgi:HSP20 family protein
MGFLMRRNDRGIVSGSVMLHDLVRNWFPDLSDVLWKDLMPESRMTVKVEEDVVKVQFAFAGCKNSDFDVESSGMFLTVRVAQRERCPAEEGDKHYSCTERNWNEYQESIKLPVPVIPNDAKAKYADGVLEITLPRSYSGKVCTKQVQVH